MFKNLQPKKIISRCLSHIDLSLHLWGISLRTASIAFAIILAIWLTLDSNSVALCANGGGAAYPEGWEKLLTQMRMPGGPAGCDNPFMSDHIATGTGIVLSVKGHQSALQLIEAFPNDDAINGTATIVLGTPLAGSFFHALSFIQGEGTVMLYVHGANAVEQITNALVGIKLREPCGVEVMKSGWASVNVSTSTGNLFYSLSDGSVSVSSSRTLIPAPVVPEVPGVSGWGFFLASSFILLGPPVMKVLSSFF